MGPELLGAWWNLAMTMQTVGRKNTENDALHGNEKGNKSNCAMGAAGSMERTETFREHRLSTELLWSAVHDVENIKRAPKRITSTESATMQFLAQPRETGSQACW